MTEESPTYSIRDYALGYLLIDFASIDFDDIGDPVSDEELAVFLEENAKEQLGDIRCSQIVARIVQDPNLYQQWLMLSESIMLDGPFQVVQEEPEPSKTFEKASVTDLSAWAARRKLLFAPRLSLAAAASLLVAGILGTVWIGSPWSDSDTKLAVQPADPQIPKANHGSVDQPFVAEADFAELIQSAFRCKLGGASNDRVCYTNTVTHQHWFIVHDSKFFAVTSPIENADKITGLQVQGNLVFIEYVVQQQFKLVLYRYSWAHDDWSLSLLHRDAIGNGYFDSVRISTDELAYQRIDESENTTKAIQIPIVDDAIK